MRGRFSVNRRSPSILLYGRYLCLEPILPVATPVAGVWRSTCKPNLTEVERKVHEHTFGKRKSDFIAKFSTTMVMMPLQSLSVSLSIYLSIYLILFLSPSLTARTKQKRKKIGNVNAPARWLTHVPSHSCVCVCVCVCQRKTKDRADGMREESARSPRRDSNLYLWDMRPPCFRLHHEGKATSRQSKQTP